MLLTGESLDSTRLCCGTSSLAQVHAWGMSRLLTPTAGEVKTRPRHTASLPPSLPHALGPKGRKARCIRWRQLQRFPTDPRSDELTDQNREGRERTLYSGFPLFNSNVKQTAKPALQSYAKKKGSVNSWNLGSLAAILCKQLIQLCPGVSYTTGIQD